MSEICPEPGRRETGPGRSAGRGPEADGLSCPACGAALAAPGPGAAVVVEGSCPRCGGRFRARRRGARPSGVAVPRPEPPTAGGLALELRGLALDVVRWGYHAGTVGGAVAVLALGGFVPVLGRWVRNELNGWGSVVETLGGVRIVARTTDPDADFGPALARADAPALFTTVEDVARRLGARPPGQVRLTYLPCCGVVAWGRRSRALILGLPLLYVLNRAELRAVLAHELAHLARGDATRSARSARFAQGLGQALDRAERRSLSPLRLWARACRRVADDLLAPIARGQEARADRAAGSIAGGGPAASALVKVALVQPLFREVLEHYDPASPDLPNLYAFFHAFWARLPEALLTSLRHRLLSDRQTTPDPAHPRLLDRLAVVQAYPPQVANEADLAPASADLGDLGALEQMLHNRLFALSGIEPSIFHRAGS